MGSFLVYASLFVGIVLVGWAYIDSNPLSAFFAWRWIGLQAFTLVVYAFQSLEDKTLDWFWCFQVLSLIFLVQTIILMAACEAGANLLWKKLFDLLSK